MVEEKYGSFYVKVNYMLVKNQKVLIKWHARNKNRLVENGYEFTKIGDEIEIPVELLSKRSAVKVKVICDNCGSEFYKLYSDHCKHGDNCIACARIQQQKTTMERYGVVNFVQSDDFKEKRNETMMEKYGTVHALQVNKCKEKFKETCLKNNGTEYPMQSKEIQEKSKQSLLENFGVEYVFQSEELKKKSVETCMERYGYKNTALVPEIRAKQRQSLYQNGDIATSKPEREMVELLQEIYGENNCLPQYPTEFYNLDCLLIVNDVKIDVEYDGQWIHSKRIKKDEARDKYHMNHGYKVLRIKGNSKTPTREQLIDSIEYLLKSDDKYYEIYI